ncbi:histidine phosphatase family protein [Pseudooceanicola nanhaiensis]|uniref:histidine phosphatase family protein n=1 Tax=Pseudooceanicola nanhaiensis TaxID=375761 RepID=UPI001CD80D57|nr:histidine phosphatase family protein [Pseudooceanicola nanhaiensis]MCA0920722.1 histidine phosphatase family protein [Pseudooceanicola nanhaiensis]
MALTRSPVHRTLPALAAMFLLAAATAPSVAAAGPYDALEQPGAQAIMRHARAPGTGDPAGFALEDCSTQRNLDGTGRAQARATGAALEAAGIRFDHVYASAWCRATETAELMNLGPVSNLPLVDSFWNERAESGPRTQALIEEIGSWPEGTRSLMVTHQVNITALTDVFPASGEIVVFRVTKGGKVELLDRIKPQG